MLWRASNEEDSSYSTCLSKLTLLAVLSLCEDYCCMCYMGEETGSLSFIVVVAAWILVLGRLWHGWRVSRCVERALKHLLHRLWVFAEVRCTNPCAIQDCQKTQGGTSFSVSLPVHFKETQERGKLNAPFSIFFKLSSVTDCFLISSLPMKGTNSSNCDLISRI